MNTSLWFRLGNKATLHGVKGPGLCTSSHTPDDASLRLFLTPYWSTPPRQHCASRQADRVAVRAHTSSTLANLIFLGPDRRSPDPESGSDRCDHRVDSPAR